MTRPRTLSLCSGYGGLDLAVEEVFGAETIAVADIDRDASAVLDVRYPDVPNLGDFTVMDWAGFDPVDIITAGYPCQPFSQAGRRKGADDDRHIWPEVLRAIRTLRPGTVVLENVRGHLSLGFGRVLGDLAESGYVGSWVCLRASDVGAPHARARVFIVATDTHRRRLEGVAQQHGAPQQVAANRHSCGRHAAGRSVEAAADPDGEAGGREGRAGQALPEPGTIERPGRCDRVALDWGPYAAAVNRWERIIGRPAPSVLNPCNPKQLNAPFVEWMMGLPEGWVTDIIPNRRALHTLGNGVVPRQAAAALRLLGPCSP